MSIVKTNRLPRRHLATVCAALLVCTGLTACQGRSTSVDPTPVTAAASASVPAGLEGYYSQDVDWYPCGSGSGMDRASSSSGFTCGTVSVPLDYEQPEGERIDIAMKRRAADGDSIGTLFINPGGPGGSGVSLVESAQETFSGTLTEHYDIVGFDPRGVGSSTAVDCLSDAELDEERSGTVGKEAEEATPQEAVDEGREDDTACTSRTEVPELLDNIDTVSAARDLDVLRAVNDQSALTYLGYSYGTYLGTVYADLFPANVGRMVLDGGVDPALSSAELVAGQAQGFERALRTYVEDCQLGSGCPLTGGTDAGVKQVRDFLDATVDNPVPVPDSDRALTRPLAESAVLGILYVSEYWGMLTEGLRQAMNDNDGSALLEIADLLAERDANGSYNGNASEAINAINCLDYPVEGDEDTWGSQAEDLEKASPTFGRGLAFPDAYCQGWGHSSRQERGTMTASGAAPILVVGTTGDPATPYDWSVSLADQLDSGQLLTWEGEGHTAYGRAGSCVTEAVDAYLLAGTMPEKDLSCSG